MVLLVLLGTGAVRAVRAAGRAAARPLAADGPAARRRRDDGRADDHPRQPSCAFLLLASRPGDYGRGSDAAARAPPVSLRLRRRSRSSRSVLALAVVAGGALLDARRGASRPPAGAIARSAPASCSSPVAQLAARDARRPLPAARPPPSERHDRRLGAAAARARPHAVDASRDRAPGGRQPSPGLTRLRVALPRLARWLVPHPPRGVLRRRTRKPMAAERRARDPARARAALLVARALGCPARSDDAGPDRVPRCRVRRSSFLGLALTFSQARPSTTSTRASPRLWGLSPSRIRTSGGVLMTAEQAHPLPRGHHLLSRAAAEGGRRPKRERDARASRRAAARERLRAVPGRRLPRAEATRSPATETRLAAPPAIA